MPYHLLAPLDDRHDAPSCLSRIAERKRRRSERLLRALLAACEPQQLTADAVQRAFTLGGASAAERPAIMAAAYDEVLARWSAVGLRSADVPLDTLAVAAALGVTGADASRSRRTHLRAPFEAVARALLAESEQLTEDCRRLERVALWFDLNPHEVSDAYRAIAPSLLAAWSAPYIAARRAPQGILESLFQRAAVIGAGDALDASLRRSLLRAHHLWGLEQLPLPRVASPVALASGERCHFTRPATWFALQLDGGCATPTHPEQGVDVQLMIGDPPGGPLRPFDPVAQRGVRLDEGAVCITQERLVFEGALVRQAVPISALEQLQVYADGLTIARSGSRFFFLAVDGDGEGEAMAVILSRLAYERRLAQLSGSPSASPGLGTADADVDAVEGIT